MPNYDFKKDFPISQETELEVAELLITKGAEVISFNNDNKYDILIKYKGKEAKVEVKEDFTCKKTGNIGVEFSCRGKPSGISVSEADFYIYKAHEPTNEIHFYMMKTKNLKKLIKNKLYKRIVNGGDRYSNSLNYLFDLEYIKQISILLK